MALELSVFYQRSEIACNEVWDRSAAIGLHLVYYECDLVEKTKFMVNILIIMSSLAIGASTIVFIYSQYQNKIIPAAQKLSQVMVTLVIAATLTYALWWDDKIYSQAGSDNLMQTQALLNTNIQEISQIYLLIGSISLSTAIMIRYVTIKTPDKSSSYLDASSLLYPNSQKLDEPLSGQQ